MTTVKQAKSNLINSKYMTPGQIGIVRMSQANADEGEVIMRVQDFWGAPAGYVSLTNLGRSYNYVATIDDKYYSLVEILNPDSEVIIRVE